MNIRKYAIILAISLMSAAPFAAAGAYDADSANYTAAYESYLQTKKATNLKESTDAYADSVSYISKAVEENPDNFKYLVLASLIYRGKGGASYAQSYFQRAEKIIVAKIKDDPDDIEAHIDYAILCHAGDGQFSNKAFAYAKTAQKEANIVIKLCQKALKADKNAENLHRALGLAYLIRGNKRESKKQLQLASQFTLEQFESDKEFLTYMLLNKERD